MDAAVLRKDQGEHGERFLRRARAMRFDVYRGFQPRRSVRRRGEKKADRVPMTMRNRGEKTRAGKGSVLLGIEEAQGIVLADVVPLPTETVFLLQALGRIIAED